LTVASAAVLLFAAVGAISAQAEPLTPGPDVQHVMVLITVVLPDTANGVRLAVLTFPSERTCLAAAEIFAKPVEHVTVVARCAPAS
jgi:hypothetical protein